MFGRQFLTHGPNEIKPVQETSFGILEPGQTFRITPLTNPITYYYYAPSLAGKDHLRNNHLYSIQFQRSDLEKDKNVICDHFKHTSLSKEKCS